MAVNTSSTKSDAFPLFRVLRGNKARVQYGLSICARTSTMFYTVSCLICFNDIQRLQRHNEEITQNLKINAALSNPCFSFKMTKTSFLFTFW